MATSITVTKKVPAGTATSVFATGATESASMTFSVFGQQSTANIDIKILPSSYTIPQDRFDATNFSKTAHTGGSIDPTQPYITETISGTTYNYLWNASTNTFRLRNSSTNLFDAPLQFGQAYYRYTDVQRGALLDNYYSSTVTLRTFTAGTGANKFTDTTTLTQAATRSGFSYSGAGAHAVSATGFAMTCRNNAYATHTLNLSSGTLQQATSHGSAPYTTFSNNITTPYTGGRFFGHGNYVFYFGPYSSTLYYLSAPISGFADNTSTNPWTYQGGGGLATSSFPNNEKITNTAYAVNTIVDFQGSYFILYNIQQYDSTGTGSNTALSNSALFRIVVNGTNGSITTCTHVYHPTPSSYGYYWTDATFMPIIDTANSRIIYKCGVNTSTSPANSTRYFSINTSGTTADYGATAPNPGTAGTLSRPYNAKTLAVNYANYNKYKFTDGMADSDGLAYYTDGSGSYNTNGQSFWTEGGKYTLIRDESLTKLDAVSTDEYWFDRQFSASKGVRVEYTGITLAPSQSFWITAQQDLQILVFGFKE